MVVAPLVSLQHAPKRYSQESHGQKTEPGLCDANKHTPILVSRSGANRLVPLFQPRPKASETKKAQTVAGVVLGRGKSGGSVWCPLKAKMPPKQLLSS